MTDERRDPMAGAGVVGEAHAARLVGLASRLAAAVTVADVVAGIVEGGLAELQADNVTVYLLDGTGSLLRLAGGAGMDAHLRARFQVVAVDDPLPAGDAVRSGELVMYASRADRNARYPQFDGYTGGAGTVLVAPMIVDDGTSVGVLSVGWQDEQRATPAAQALTTAVAELCGRTVVRARQHDIAQRALAGQRMLDEATRLFNESLDLDVTLQAVADMIVPALVDVCVICLLDEHGDLRPVVAVTDDEDRREVVDKLIARQPVIANPELLDVVSTGLSSHVHTVDRREDALTAEDETHLQLIRALDATSWIMVPLTGPDRIAGAMVLLVVGDRAPLGEASVQLAEALASRAGAAIHNADAHTALDRRAGHLQHALESRIVIEQAKGMLAARWQVTPTTAFTHLRAAARTRRVRIHDLATAVIAGTDDLPDPPTS